ncbi:MAG: 3-phosphoserine/phosphohydroxythreonine transaminase [Candidatus Nitrotoga sp.]|nr:3-phosphoserine/phosphohydroxythreonine transaminase [Candidatus Nitrotoga sp.]MBP0116767.1 3-phosphoserine/phosphohydroxythreonine transaminase [Candidatus Nitrotoga sp.]MBP0125615.1 3-phosphoserine/phosphohydroxythreonine transaminase [Candidatus Nitrotoga sp.]MDW7534925.1 3-phosphoserine/phosphohydroxythreonine transaminase [Candidatus Nitrotoga sp.]MDW7604940.1 3-phosphoserine/phosphohydroxythreonine transaminase [Candidatus Nitrotoga sp.]
MTVYNFSAGPAVLPHEVLEQARDELLDWHGSGMSVMEMSHRGKEFMGIAATAEADLRDLLAIPTNYKVLFLQGGAHLQFAMIPLNLLREKSSCDYVNTGEWSKKAITEAKKFNKVNVVASGADKNFVGIPAFDTWQCDPQAAYLHYTSNETIGGVEFNWTPETGEVPLVADMSSNIISRQVDVSKYGLIYAGAQKNIGPAGLCIAIVRDDLLGGASSSTPTMLDYKTHADNDSMYNTPPTYGIYMAGLVFQWLKCNGGLAKMEQANLAKSGLLYQAIDTSNGFYNCPVVKSDRSRMNVPFTLKDAKLDGEFLKQAEANGLLQLKGHRSVGGMRASIYNAMPLSGVQALVEFIMDFAKRHG